jgi:hypothetical protein
MTTAWGQSLNVRFLEPVLALLIAACLLTGTACGDEPRDSSSATEAQATEAPLSFGLACSWATTYLNVGATGMAIAVGPDTTCTPGSVDPEVTQANYLLTICAPGYVERVRPPESYLADLKLRQMSWYRLNQAPSELEMNYVVPLELGGAPRDPRNLWPAPKANAYKEIIQAVLTTVKRRACAAEMSLAEAQTRVANATRGGLAAAVSALSAPVMGARVPPDGRAWYTSALRNTNHYYCDLDDGWRTLKPEELRRFDSEEALLLEWAGRRSILPESKCSHAAVALAAPTAATSVTALPNPTPTAANSPPATSGRPNLVRNPSFEEPGVWRIVRAGGSDLPTLHDTTVARTGNNSARIDHFPGGNCPGICGYWTPPMAVTPGQQYEISAWFKLSDTLVGQSGIYVTLRVAGAGGTFEPLFGFPAGARTAEWTQVVRSLTVPATSAAIVIDISWWRNIEFPNAQGTIWLDDISVR